MEALFHSEAAQVFLDHGCSLPLTDFAHVQEPEEAEVALDHYRSFAAFQNDRLKVLADQKASPSRLDPGRRLAQPQGHVQTPECDIDIARGAVLVVLWVDDGCRVTPS